MDQNDNINTLNHTSFRLVIDTSDFKYVEFMCQEALIPAVSMTPADATFRNSRAPVSGDTPFYGLLSVSFLVDENFKAYESLYNWLLWNQHNTPKEYDMTLHVLSNQHNVNRKFEFKNAFIADLSQIELSVQNTGEPLVCDAEISFTRFELK